MPNLLRFLHHRSIRAMLRGALSYVFGKRGQRRVQSLRLFYRLRMEILIHLEGPLRALTRRTEVRLWVDGREAFPRLEKLLRRARHTIIIQMYIWKDDRVGRWFAGILLDAADRGVHIDVTKEAVGDVFEFRDFLTTQASMEPLWRHFWNHPNIRITHVTRNDHTKVFVIDDQILLLTGMNIADEYEESWHDYMVELRGHRFVAQYLMEGAPQPGKVQLILNTQRVRQVRGAVMHLLSSAQRSILIEQCYFSDPKVVDLLIRRSHEGVRITLIVPEAQDLHYHANMQAIGRLLVGSSPGCVQVLLYPGIVHGKVILADRTRMFLGSANLMASSLDEQGEACVLVDGYRIALGKLREVLRGDILKGRPLVSPPQFRWLGRWLAWIGL